MNAFSDIVFSVGTGECPTITRLGNPWLSATPGPAGVWTSDGTRPSAGQTEAIVVASWRVWAIGDVFAYRDETIDPLNRFAADLAADRLDAGRLDAHAAIFAWDEATRRLHVWIDRMGTVHAYVGGPQGRVRVGTSYAAVAEASAGNLDWVGITGFCGFGFYVADRTALEDVRILRPATHTIFDQSGRRILEERYWDWSYEPETRRSDEEFLDSFHEIWTATLARQVHGRRPIVPVSGGLDSRTIVAGLTGRQARPGSTPALFTYGYSSSSVEIMLARRVARSRRQPIMEVVVEPYLFDRLDDVVGSVEGFSALSLPRQVGVSERIAPLGDRVVGGHWGDVWFDAAGASTGASTCSGDLVEPAFAKFAKRGRSWLLEEVCRPHLHARDPEDVLREVLRAELERLPDLGDADQQLKALKTEQWSFRWTLASIRAYQLAAPTLMPFYANDVVDFFLRVPSGRLPGRRLQTAYLRRHHPDLARIRWQDSGTSLFGHPWERPLRFARLAAAKADRSIRRRQPVERNWEVQYLTGTEPDWFVTHLLQAESPTVGLVAAGAIEALIDRFRSKPDASNGYTVDALLTVVEAAVNSAGGQAASELAGR